MIHERQDTRIPVDTWMPEYFVNCLDTWFSRGNKCCPLCRSDINEYQDSVNHYKLVIYERQNNNQTRNEAVLLAQRLIAENLKLKFYMWFSFAIYILYFYQYYS